MSKNSINIWMWIQDGKIIKAITNMDEGSLKIYDEHDCLIMKRTGLNKLEVKEIENNIIKYGAKKINTTAEPFRFL